MVRALMDDVAQAINSGGQSPGIDIRPLAAAVHDELLGARVSIPQQQHRLGIRLPIEKLRERLLEHRLVRRNSSKQRQTRS